MSRGPYSDAELGIDPREGERQDLLADARAEQAERRPRYCSFCTGGHNCPECSGWEDAE